MEVLQTGIMAAAVVGAAWVFGAHVERASRNIQMGLRKVGKDTVKGMATRD